MPYPPRKHAPDYFAVDRPEMVPLLIDGEVGLRESMAICDYLATKHSGSPLVLYPPNNRTTPVPAMAVVRQVDLMTPLSRLNIVRQVERKGPEVDAIIAGARDHVAERPGGCAGAASRGSRLPRKRLTLADLVCRLSASPGRHAGRRQSAGDRAPLPIANGCARGRPTSAPSRSGLKRDPVPAGNRGAGRFVPPATRITSSAAWGGGGSALPWTACLFAPQQPPSILGRNNRCHPERGEPMPLQTWM